jgi:hypothetical protein
MTDARHFVQIELVAAKSKTIYRFFGRGEWQKKDGRKWRTVNAIYVPAEALSLAAAQCAPAPALTKIHITKLRGGSR